MIIIIIIIIIINHVMLLMINGWKHFRHVTVAEVERIL
jgi:hypothetical protein